ncbi:MAG: bifunctional heptose 7-phosphate kinase/heptose 1-phosphate adenyltransferase [Bacteroidota bacterium]
MGFKSIYEVLVAFKKLKVLVIGDVMIDAYIYGSVKRISPEAPVPVLSVTKREKRLGGAANVALNVQALGAKPILCSVIGNDNDAKEFYELLEAQNLSKEGILESDKRITTVKNRVMSSSQHLLRIDSEIESNLSEQDQLFFISKLKSLMTDCDLIIFEDYDKGVLNEKIIEAVIEEANKLNIPTAVDPKKRNFNAYKACTLFKPNLKELREGLGIDIDPKLILEVEQAVVNLKNILQFEKALITLSEYGVYFHSDKEKGQYPAHLRSISDVSGAGDTVISIAGLALALKLPLPFISELANLGGGIVCEYQGVVPIDPKRLLAESTENQILKGFLS